MITPDEPDAPLPAEQAAEVDRCRPADLVVNGRRVTALIHGARPLDTDDRHALGELAAAALALADRRDPAWAVRQELLRATRIALRCIPRGHIPDFPRDRDGATVKDDLDRAVRAAVRALSPDPVAESDTTEQPMADPPTPTPAARVALSTLEALLDEVAADIERVEQDLRLHRPPMLDAARDLYRLRARVDDALNAHDSVLVDEELRTEAEHLRRALDEFHFTDTAPSGDVHIVEPWTLPDESRTLCGEPITTRTTTRPEGTLCGTCARAFAEHMFPTGPPPADATHDAR